VSLVRLRQSFLPLGVVVFQLGVHSALAVAFVAVALGVSFALAGQMIAPMATSQLLRLFILLSSESVGVLLTLMLFLIRGLLPISQVVHLMLGWPRAQLRLQMSHVRLGAGLAAAVLFMDYQLFSLLALTYVTDGWLDLADFGAVLQNMQPEVLLFSCLRTALLAMLATQAVLSRWWPLQPLPAAGAVAHQAVEPFDPWRPQRQLPQIQLTAVYSDLFRLLVLLIVLELGYQLSGLPGSLSAG
jgi:hypothetical protein